MLVARPPGRSPGRPATSAYQHVSITTGRPACQHVSMSSCQHVSMLACQPVSMSRLLFTACQHISMSACQQISIMTGRPACQHVSMTTGLPVCQHVSMSAFQHHDRPAGRTCQHVIMSACLPNGPKMTKKRNFSNDSNGLKTISNDLKSVQNVTNSDIWP